MKSYFFNIAKVAMFICVFFMQSLQISAATPQEFADGFITTWKTNNPGVTASNQIRIPTTGAGYNYDVDWGDGNTDTGITGSFTHTYAAPGTYTVRIAGDFPSIYFNSGGDRRKILTVNQWGPQQWVSMSQAFAGASNLNVVATDTPDLSIATNLSAMFASASVFNGDLSSWDVSTITDTSFMFVDASAFNQPLNSWDVSSVTDMRTMFTNATSFNQPLNSWNTGSATNMSDMFNSASSFNQNLSTWNTSNVTDMSYMFQAASSYNQPMYAWNVANVTNMSSMFDGATAFNQPLYAWNTANVTSMPYMFNNSSFNQTLDSWNVTNVTNMDQIFGGLTLSTSNYDAILNGWSADLQQNGITFGVGNSTYCAVAARDILTTTYAWSITDGGEVVCDTTGPVITSVLATVATSTATISYSTNEAATSTIVYGTTLSYGATSTIATATTTSSITLTGLTHDTTYFFLVTSYDASGNYSTSSGSFTTDEVVVATPAPAVVTQPSSTVTYGSGYVASYVSNTSPIKISVPTAQNVCQAYIGGDRLIKRGIKNNIDDVKKIQTFLNTYEGGNLVVDGEFKVVDEQAVRNFQTKYKTQILSPWGLSASTGVVYVTTKAKMNAIVCGQNFGCPVFTKKTDSTSNHGDVPRVKNFLNQILGLQLNTQSQSMDSATVQAISTFQTRYKDFVLKPLGLTKSTGLWYESTMKQANAFMGCNLK
ncbi:MAG: BspA family leucine-rich repeat surface protein [Patescibacteria group bacterium]